MNSGTAEMVLSEYYDHTRAEVRAALIYVLRQDNPRPSQVQQAWIAWRNVQSVGEN